MFRWWRQRPRQVRTTRAERVHVGCGREALAGWVNVDIVAYPEVDVVCDIRRGLPFTDVEYIYAEHFVEHFSFDEVMRFFKACRRALRDSGVLRVSTPNLDWVMATQYTATSSDPSPQRIASCFAINKAFRGWGHQFLFNVPTLAAALQAAGFASITFHVYGQSGDPALSNLERHERSTDTRELPHVIIAEARGISAGGPDPLGAAFDDYDVAMHG